MAVRLPMAWAVTLMLTLVVVMSVRGSGFGFPRVLTLERGLPIGMSLEALRARDRARHGRSLLSGGDGVIDFPVKGSGDPFTVGLYFTQVKLGNPAKEFYVQIDTGSDILWVTCASCNGCPTSSGLNIPLEFFDIKKSSTASKMTCSNENCISAIQTGEASCQTDSSSSFCGYTFQYGDGSGTSGYYVSDTIYFSKATGGEQTTNSSATVIFGCSNLQSGDLTKSDRAVDGIFGFGQQALSVISQLSSQGVAPNVFSHCLRGSDNGGGILVLGEIVEPGVVYTPMVPSQPHYNVNLTSIAVNGKTVPIDPSVFLTTSNKGTIIDSGTTLAYLAEQAYDPFVNAIKGAISSSVNSVIVKGNQCYITAGSPEDIFPSVTLYFSEGASMSLKPQDYLLQQDQINNAIVWCIGWQKNTGQGITILGDLVLKDKIFVYDIANQRIGWKNYDCSLSVNVSTTSGKNEFVNTAQPSQNGSPQTLHFNLLTTCVAVFLAHIFAYAHRCH